MTVKKRRTSFQVGLLMVAALSVMWGCSKPLTRFDMVGNYVADYPFAKENLTLFRDGSFTQQVIIKATSQAYSAYGGWAFYASQSRIDFTKEFMNVLDGFGKGRNPPVAGGASLPVTRPFGTVRISEYPVAAYKKQKQPLPWCNRFFELLGTLFTFPKGVHRRFNPQSIGFGAD